MSNVLLGVIALSVLIMATLQVAAAVIAAKAFKRVADTVDRLDADVRPIINNIQQVANNIERVTADATRVSSLAVAQVERIDTVMSDVARHVERTAAAIPQLIETARDSFSVIGGIKAVIAAFQEMRRGARNKASVADDEDPLFVG